MPNWILVAMLVLAPPPPVQVALPTDLPPPPEQVMALPPELRARVRADADLHRGSRAERLQKLVDFMFLPEPAGLGMVYRGDASYTVSQAHATRRGNCLAFTLMFLALADDAGLDAWPQEIAEALAWHRSNDTLYRASHVNAGVRIGSSVYTVDTSPDAVIAREPPARIPIERLLAHYYNNNAAALLEQGRLPVALRYMSIALARDPGFAAAWNNAGVLHLRNGDRGAAERAYATALALDPDNSGALFNMVGLQRDKGDRAREAEFRERLERVQGKDPFHHFLQGMDCQRAGDNACAIDSFRRAIRLLPREYRFHAALAAAYRQAGDLRRAGQSMARARELGGDAAIGLDLTVLGGLRQPDDLPPGG